MWQDNRASDDDIYNVETKRGKDERQYLEDRLLDNYKNTSGYSAGDLAELGVIVQEYDKLENQYRTLNSDTAATEKKFLDICLKFKSERDEWKQEQIRFHNMEHENAKMGKDLGYLKKNYQKTKANLEKEEEKSKNLENKITELEEIINLMKEIVFSDSDEHSAERRARFHNLQTSMLSQKSSEEDMNSTEQSNTTAEKVSDNESELNQAYGEYYTSNKTKMRQSREYIQDYPVPSGHSSYALPPTTPTQSTRLPPPLMSPLKSSLKSSPGKRIKNHCKFTEDPSFLSGDAPIYQSPMKAVHRTPVKPRIIKITEDVSSELVLYVSALQDKLGHPELYIRTPDTEDLDMIESTKDMIRSGHYDEDTILDELMQKSTTVICQLVKDFFSEKKDILLIGGDDLFEKMLQAVRCCNDQYLMELFGDLSSSKQFELAFLIIHLQSAVDHGRSPGELACAFSKVICSDGYRNKNDPKELIEKLIEINPKFYNQILNPTEFDQIRGSLLGPVDQSENSKASWKNMIKERQSQLMKKLDVKLLGPRK